MPITKIGVIADTHVPEFLPALPESIKQHFQDVDLILHAGDITGQGVLDELRTITPVVAVKGDHDTLPLPQQVVIEIGSVRIDLIHGRRSRWQEFPSILSNEVFANRFFWWGGFQSYVLKTFNHVDAIIFGHFHRPYCVWHQGVLLFNPGAVYQLNPERIHAELSRSPSFLRRAYLLNAYRKVPIVPSIGLLTIEERTIQAEILPISE